MSNQIPLCINLYEKYGNKKTQYKQSIMNGCSRLAPSRIHSDWFEYFTGPYVRMANKYECLFSLVLPIYITKDLTAAVSLLCMLPPGDCLQPYPHYFLTPPEATHHPRQQGGDMRSQGNRHLHNETSVPQNRKCIFFITPHHCIPCSLSDQNITNYNLNNTIPSMFNLVHNLP